MKFMDNLLPSDRWWNKLTIAELEARNRRLLAMALAGWSLAAIVTGALIIVTILK
jgi:hypothetical protein